MNRLSLLSAAVLAIASPAFAHPTEATESTISLPDEADSAANVVDDFHAALSSGDVETASALLAPDVVVLESGGAEHSRDEYGSHHLGSDAAFAAATEAEVLRRTGAVVGDVAWIASEGRVRGEFNGRAVDRLTAESMVLVRRDGGWKIQQIHWSSRAAPTD
ncbi:MAG: nuclear transport factor 2 family protein [Caulobacterales bacterium]|nr:nuclear transport factor 2 family protein [Caulobacterales bacterium]